MISGQLDKHTLLDAFRSCIPLKGDPTLRIYNESSFSQQAISYKCLNFDTESTTTNHLPLWEDCPAGIRAQVVSELRMRFLHQSDNILQNFPSCWDGEVIAFSPSESKLVDLFLERRLGRSPISCRLPGRGAGRWWM